jgi:pilus assembly protein Flp/PilA
MLEAFNRLALHLATRRDRVRGQAGQGLVEYGLILVLVSIAVVVALTAVSGQLGTVFNTITNKLATS